MSWSTRSHSKKDRIVRVVLCSAGLLALLLAGVAWPTDADACHDFGDAPFYYGTLSVDAGANHAIQSGFHLGATVDEDGDGQPSVGANGDDLGGIDDEDGIMFTSPLSVGSLAGLDAIASQAGLLNAWLDFNADGDWDDAGEQIFSDLAVVAGVNSLSIAVPGNAMLGDTYARFRLDSCGGLTPYGVAPDGEVEDYRVSIVPEPSALSLVALGLTGWAAFRRLRK